MLTTTVICDECNKKVEQSSVFYGIKMDLQGLATSLDPIKELQYNTYKAYHFCCIEHLKKFLCNRIDVFAKKIQV